MHQPGEMQSVTSSPLLDVRATSQFLDCSPRHVRRLSELGRMPQPVKIGALVRWRRRDIERWLEAGCPAVRRGQW